MKSIEQKKDANFNPRETAIMCYKCSDCNHTSYLTVVLEEQPKKASRRRPQKSEKNATNQKTPLLRPSLSLNDFLL